MLPKPRIQADKLLCEEISEFLSFAQSIRLCDRLSTQSDSEKAPSSERKAMSDPTSSVSATEPEERKIQCYKCSGTFKSMKGLKQHIGKKHDLRKKYSSCRICKKKFRNVYAVRFHVKQVHDKSTRVTCEVCNAERYNKYSLRLHRSSDHHEDELASGV